MSKKGLYVSLGMLAAVVLGVQPAPADNTPSATTSGNVAEWRPVRIRFQGNLDYCLGVDAAGQPEAGNELKVLPCLYEHAYVDLAYDANSGRLRFSANANLCLGRPQSGDSGRLVTTSCAAADVAAVDFKTETVALRGTEPVCVDKGAAARPCKGADADQRWQVIGGTAR